MGRLGVGSDPSDFLNSQNYSGDGTSPLTLEDAFNEFYDGSTLQYLTPADLEQMDILGFHLKEDAPAEDAYDFNGRIPATFCFRTQADKLNTPIWRAAATRDWSALRILRAVPSWAKERFLAVSIPMLSSRT